MMQEILRDFLLVDLMAFWMAEQRDYASADSLEYLMVVLKD